MSWKDGIRGCFGIMDHKYAGHPLDAGRAKKVLQDALAEGVTESEYLEAFEEHLKSKNVTAKHLEKEMEKIRLSSHLSF